MTTGGAAQRVTVVVLTYEHVRFLRDALDSVLEQRTSFDFDVVVIDDASTDGTTGIVQEYEQRHPHRVRAVIHERNECSNRSFRETFNSTATDYVAVLDGDDVWTDDEKLQLQVDFLDAHPKCAICFHDAEIRYEGSDVGWRRNGAWQPEFTHLQDLLAVNFISGCTPLVRRNAIDELPPWFEDIHLADWALYLLLARSGPVGYIDSVMGLYRLHEGGFWSRRSASDKLGLVVSFYDALRDQLGPEYRELIDHHRALSAASLRIEQRREAAVSAHCSVTGRASCLGARVLDLVDREVPPDDPVAIVTSGDAAMLTCAPRPAVNYPPAPAEAVQLLATAGDGSAHVPNVAEGVVYEVTLADTAERRGAEHVRVFSRGQRYREPPKPKLAQGWDLRVDPNPIPSGPEWGHATISWTCAISSIGRLVLRKFHCPLPPDTAEAAIDGIRSLVSGGSRYFVIPATSFEWMTSLPTVRVHLESTGDLVFSDADCMIFRLAPPATVDLA